MKYSLKDVKIMDFPERGDERGQLVIAEGKGASDDVVIPFEIKRVFYIYGSDDSVIRGQHANRETEFVLINVAGSSKVKAIDGDGNEAKLVSEIQQHGDQIFAGLNKTLGIDLKSLLLGYFGDKVISGKKAEKAAK